MLRTQSGWRRWLPVAAVPVVVTGLLLLGVPGPGWASIPAPNVSVPSLTVTKVATWTQGTMPQTQHLAEQDVAASYGADLMIITVSSQYADAVHSVRYSELTPWSSGASQGCAKASATRYECGGPHSHAVRLVRVSWHVPKLAAHLTGSSLTATVTAEASMTVPDTPGDAQSGSGSVTLRPSIDVEMRTFQPGPTPSGGIGLATALFAPAGQQLPPGTLRITGYGAKPAYLGSATWADGSVTVPVDGSVTDYRAFINSPVAQDWQTRAFTATFTPQWGDPNGSNNSRNYGPEQTGGGGGGTGTGGSGGSSGGGGSNATPGSEPTATVSASAAASASAGATTSVAGRSQPPQADGGPSAAPDGGLGTATIVATSASVVLLGALAGAGWWWMRRRAAAG